MAAQGGQINFKVGFQTDQASLNNLKKSLQDLQNIKLADFKGSKQELEQLKQTARGVETTLKNTFNVNLNALNVKQFNQQLTKSVGSIDKIYQEFSKAGVQGQVAFSQMANSVLTSNLQLKETNSIIQKMGTTLVNSIKWNIASSAINSFTQGVQSAFQYVKSLESSLTDIRIVTGDSQQKMQEFAASANKAAQALGRSTMDYTKSALTFYQQGLDDEAVAARTEAVLKAQNITGTGSEMADYLTAVWNGYKVANEQAELYVDKLAAVADSSASDMSQLAIAMSRVSSTANTMGVNVDQLTAQIATVIATTRQAPQSVGTAFKTIYARLNDIKVGADEAQISLGNYSGRMANLGFQVLDSNGRLRDTGQIMEQIGNRWQELTKEQQIYLASTMGGQRQVNQLMALFDNWTTYSELLNTSLDSQGSLAEKNARYMESLGAKMEQLGAAQERVKDAFIDTDSWKSVLEVLTSIVSLFGNLVQSIGGGGNALLAFGSIATQVFSGAISNELNKIITNINNAKGNVQKIKNDIAMTKAYGNSQGYADGVISQMVKAKQEISQYYSIMSTQQINSYNNIVKQIGATQDQVRVTEDLITNIEKFQSGLIQAGKAVDNNLTTQIDVAVDAAEELSETLNRYSSISFLRDNQIEGVEEFQIVLDRLQAAVGENNSAIPALDEFQKSLEDITNSGIGTTNQLNRLRRAAKAALSQVNNVLGKDLDQIKAKAKEDAAALELAESKKEQFLGAIKQQAFSKTIVDSVGVIGSLTSGINSLTNVTQVWKNESLSASEKVLQTFTNFGYTISSAAMSYQRLVQMHRMSAVAQKAVIAQSEKEMALNNAKQAQEAAISKRKQAERAKETADFYAQIARKKSLVLSIKTQENAERAATNAKLQAKAASELDRIASQADAAAKEKEAAATLAAAAAHKAFLMSLGFAVAVPAIIGLVKVYDQLTMSVKEADQALKSYNEKQKQLSSNSTKTKQDITNLKSLREEYEKLSEKAGLYDQNIENLSDSEKQRWNQIKNKIAEVNPEIVAAYNQQGQAILANNDALDQSIEKLQRKNQLELESWVNSSDFKKATKARKTNYENAKDDLSVLQMERQNLGTSSIADSSSAIQLITSNSNLDNEEEQAKINEFLQLSYKNIEDFTEQDKENYQKLINHFKSNENNNEQLRRIFESNSENLLNILESQIKFREYLNGQIVAAQKKVEALSDADTSSIMFRLQSENDNKGQYEALKKQGVENMDAYILSYLQGNKQAMADNEDALVANARDFETELLIAFQTHKDLDSIFKTLKSDIQKQGYETQQEYITALINGVNEAIEEKQLTDVSQNVLTSLINSIFNVKLTDQNFGDNGTLETVSSDIVDTAAKIQEQFKAHGQDVSLNDILNLNTEGLDFNSILNGLKQVTNYSKSWDIILGQIVAKQKTAVEQQQKITDLSVISSVGQQLQQGKNPSTKQRQSYLTELENLSANEGASQKARAAAETLKNTWLAGTKEYQEELGVVQLELIKLNQIQAQSSGKELTEQQTAQLQSYATTVERVNNLYEQGYIKDQAYYHTLLNKALEQQLKTLNKTGAEYNRHFKHLQKLSKQTKSTVDGVNNLRQEVNLTDEQLQEMTINDLTLIDSLEELQKTYKNLKDDLDEPQDSQKFTEAFTKIIDIINKIPGINIDPEEENATEYLTNIKQLAQGVEGALERLRQKLAEQEIKKIQVEAELDERSISVTVLNRLNELIQSLSPEDIQTHAYLQDQAFVNQLNALIRNAGLTADQCNRILSKIGVKANVTTRKIALPSDFTPGAPIVGKALANSANEGIKKNPIPSMQEIEIPDKITYEPINSSEVSDLLPQSTSGGKSGGGGGGGSKPKDKEVKKQTRDVYHDINRQIQHLTDSYEKLEDQEDKLVGNDLIDNLKDQNKLLQEQKVLYNDKLGLVDAQQEKLKQLLQVQGVVFDPQSGQITNYNQILDQKLAEYKKQVQAYNTMSADARKQHQEELEKAWKEYQEFKKNLEEYQKTLDLRRTVLDAINDIDEKQIENKIKDFKVQVQLDLDLSQAKRDWNQFEKEVIDQIRDDDILGNVQARLKDIYSYFGDDLSGGVISSLTDQVYGTLDELHQLEDGVSDIYGKNQAQALEDLTKYSNKLMDSLKDVQQILKDVKQAFFDVIDAAQEAFDEQTNEYEFLEDLFNHNKKLIELLYGEQAYDKLAKYNDDRAAADKQSLQFAKQQKNFWWQQMQNQQKHMEGLNKESNAYKQAEQRLKALQKKWMDSVKDFNSKLQKSIENVFDKYQNNIQKIFKDYGDKITGGKGLQYVSQEWQIINDYADDYLDKVNGMYAIQQLQNSYKDAIDDNKDNTKAQASLNKMMNQQLKMLKDKDKLTQYDVDRANLLLQIEVKRLALQQAQQNNTKLRLRRDSQGNYTYQYVADDSAISDAQKELSDLQNQLYNLDKQEYTGNLNKIYSLEQEAWDKLKALYAEYPVWTEQAERKRKLIIEKYGPLINTEVSRNEEIKSNLQDSAFTELSNLQDTNLENFLNMSRAEQDQIMNNLVPQWKSGVQEMTDAFAGQGGFIPTCQKSLDALDDNVKECQNGLKELEESAGQNFESIGNGIDDTIDKTNSLIDTNEDLIKVYQDEFDAINQVIDSLGKLTKQYNKIRNAAIAAAEAAMEFKQAIGQGDFADGVDSDDGSQPGYTGWKNIGQDGNFKWTYLVNGKRVTGQQKNLSYTDPDGNSFVADYNFDENGILLPSNENASHNGLYGAINVRKVTDSVDRLNDTMNKMIDDTPGYVLGRRSASENKMIDDTPGYVSVRRIASGASGMYTGSWGDNSGKLAVLHQKELVLNKEDTSNILSTVNIVRSMSDLLLGLQDNLIPSSTSQNNFGVTTKNSLDQNVYITASFPSVQNRTEIEMALNNLVNRASQYAFSNNR